MKHGAYRVTGSEITLAGLYPVRRTRASVTHGKRCGGSQVSWLERFKDSDRTLLSPFCSRYGAAGDENCLSNADVRRCDKRKMADQMREEIKSMRERWRHCPLERRKE